MTHSIRVFGPAAVGLSLALSSGVAHAGTASQKAVAAVAVARAQLELADARPELPDMHRSENNAGVADRRSESRSTSPRVETTGAPSDVAESQVPKSDRSRNPESPSTILPMKIEMARVGVISDILPAQLVVSTWERGCPACQRQERDIRTLLTPLNWTVGEHPTDQIRFAPVATTQTVPQIMLFQNGIEIRRWQGYQDPGMLSRELRAAWDAAGNRIESAAASGCAGEIQASSQIRTALDWWRKNVGTGRQAKFSWDRTGANSFPLLAKGDWSAKALFGEAGRIDLAVTGAVGLPVDAGGFSYRILGPDVVINADPIVIPGLATRLGPANSQQISGAVPAQLVDPLTAWSIFSMLREIWQLLHPTCDLQLGGRISASAVLSDETLVLDFQECPSIKFVALFTFQLRVVRVEINESSVRLIFSGSRIVKERTFHVK